MSPGPAPMVVDVQGQLVIEWPDPRPLTFEITAEAFEMFIDALNEARARCITPAPDQTGAA